MPGMNLPDFGVVPVSSQKLSTDSRAISLDEKTRTRAGSSPIVLLMNLAATPMRLYVTARSKLYCPSRVVEATKRLMAFVTTCVPALMLLLCCSRRESYGPSCSCSCRCRRS